MASASWIAVTVTVCSVFQVFAVKVSCEGAAVISAPSGTSTVTVTSAAGSVSSATV